MTTFDTLKFAQRLERAGLDPQQAIAFSKAQKEAFDEVFDSQVATKADMIKLEAKINLVHWMIGFNLAFTFAMFWKMFIGQVRFIFHVDAEARRCMGRIRVIR